MVANIAFFVFLGGAALITAAITIARFTPESRNDEISKMDWVLISMLLIGLAMALISFFVFAIAGATDNVDHYGRSMGILFLTAAAVFLIALLLARKETASRAH